MDFRGLRSPIGRWAVSGLLAFAAVATTAAAGRAQDYPSHPVRIIVPTGPGGSYDVVARLVADQLGRRMGRRFVVENRSGAGTIVGTQAAVAAEPDGYTLLSAGLSNIVFNGSLYKKPPYDALTQLVPVAIVYKLAYIMVGSADLPYPDVKAVIAAAKEKPGILKLAHAGVGTGQQLAGVSFMKATGAQLAQVPYKNATEVYPDLLAGRVDVTFDSITAAMPYVKAGKVKGLALLSSERAKDLPDVPTMTQAGVPGLDIDSWIGIFAPAGTPQPVIAKLQTEIAAAQPELAAKFEAVGGAWTWIEPADLGPYVQAENGKWSKLIKEAGISLD